MKIRILFLGTLTFLARPLTVSAVDFKFKGFIKAEVVHSNKSVGSYGDSYSHVAVTKANLKDTTTPQTKKYSDSASTSFQTAQSRFAFEVTEGKVYGILEFGLIDPASTGFTNQGPLQAAGPRTRLAFINYTISQNTKFFIGQKWGSATGIPWNGSFNYVGGGLTAGNTGFLNNEAGLTHKLGEVSITGAITGKGKNAAGSTADGANQNELGHTPGVAGNVEYKQEDLLIGLAGHWGKMIFQRDDAFTSGHNRNAFVAMVYASNKFGALKFDLEAYLGSNLGGLNALGVASRPVGAGHSSRERGAWFGLAYDLSEVDVFRLSYGMAEVSNGTAEELSATQMNENSYAYLNYGRNLGDGLTWFAQYTYFNTSYGFGSAKRNPDASVWQSGMLYKF